MRLQYSRTIPRQPPWTLLLDHVLIYGVAVFVVCVCVCACACGVHACLS